MLSQVGSPGRTRTGKEFPPADFKSAVFTISPLGLYLLRFTKLANFYSDYKDFKVVW
jgi:hypothetical protein